jgi:hypothetical protein
MTIQEEVAVVRLAAPQQDTEERCDDEIRDDNQPISKTNRNVSGGKQLTHTGSAP